LLSALLGDPWLLVLDEPSNGLDPAGSGLVVDIVSERRAAGLGTLLASNDAAFVSQIGGARWRIVEGRLQEVPA
jgi:ABC-type multidrug transport system ATPase subunit